MIRVPALGRALFRCRLCGWVGRADPPLADDASPWAVQPALLGLPEWAIHRCDDGRGGIADLVGFEPPPVAAKEDE